jgi:hypothetical protein
MDCPHHEAIVVEIANAKAEKLNIWSAITELRKEVKSLSWKLALIVGGISALTPLIDLLKK